MQKKFTLILILVLVLAQLCACSPAQTPSVPAAEPEAAQPVSAAELPKEQEQTQEPAAAQSPQTPASLRTPERVLTAKKYTAEIYTRTIQQYRCRVESREYLVSDGTTVRMYRAQGVGGSRFFDRTVAGSGTIRYYDMQTGQWVSQALAEGTFTSPVVVVEPDSGGSYFFALPRTFILRENDSKEYLPEMNGALHITQSGTGFHLTVDGYGLTAGRVTDALIMTAPFALNWELDNCAKAWVTYVKSGDSQWCYDGYYRKSPNNYIPTGTNYYYCCAASYCIKGFLSRMPLCKEAAALTLATLDTVTQRQNQYGYWATEPGSEWLQGDYGIGAGFYDTRFNTDLLEIYIKATRKFGGNLFADVITRYLGFFNQIADTSHISTENGGWLVPDYWHPDEITAPHTSLNHQASECLALYHAADLLRRDDLRTLADRMLLAIEDTGSGWVMPNHNLYYSIKPDGTYVEGDYPYLTYNDLYYLRKYLTGFGREENKTLTYLMGEKLQWMQNHGVTGYEKG